MSQRQQQERLDRAPTGGSGPAGHAGGLPLVQDNCDHTAFSDPVWKRYGDVAPLQQAGYKHAASITDGYRTGSPPVDLDHFKPLHQQWLDTSMSTFLPGIEVEDYDVDTFNGATCAYPTPRTSRGELGAPPDWMEHSHTPSTASSVGSTFSSSTLSPVNCTDACCVMDGLTAVSSTWSRGPSPLPFYQPGAKTPVRSPESLANHLQPGTDMTDTAEKRNKTCADLIGLGSCSDAISVSDSALRPCPEYQPSFPCNWAGCASPVFLSRDGLNWHVKAEHLVICPVPGCPETSFHSSLMLRSHVRVAHTEFDPDSGTNVSGVGGRKAFAQTLQPILPSPGGDGGPEVAHIEPTGKQEAEEESAETPKSKPRARDSDFAAVKMTQLVAKSKKRCRDQLQKVVERRAKRANVRQLVTPDTSPDSPPGLVRSRTPKLVETASFPIIWEHGILPFLVEFMPRWCGPGHVISVSRAGSKASNARRICIMTRRPLSRARKVVIAAHVQDLMPSSYRQAASFSFAVGSVTRLVWARGLGPGMPDEICQPRNPYCYNAPTMGDSIGTTVDDPAAGESTSTLGPCLIVGGGAYWLANLHPFLTEWQRRGRVEVSHPSPADREQCVVKRHDVLDGRNFRLGELIATSGVDLRTTRVSHEPYWDDNDRDPPLVATDWTLIGARTCQANMLRRFPSTTTRQKDVPVTRTSPVTPGAEVLSAGRTSGHQRGQVCEIPAYVDGEENGIGRATREWFVEQLDPADDEDSWIRGGIGVEGDSGAAIVDAQSNCLVGQLWARNKYWGPGPRHAYFTPLSDIFDDIQERCGQQSRPELPQFRDEADCWPCHPVCRTCFDLRAYLESRRSSRESLRSVVGQMDGMSRADSAEAQNETLNEAAYLTSPDGISDLAPTPKDPGSHWVRHTGQDEGGPSIANPTSAFSSLFTGFSFGSQAGTPTPGINDVRSPYAVALSDEDLYGAEYDESPVSGKRQALPMLRIDAQVECKRAKMSSS